MQLWQDGLLAGLASVGLATLLWLTVRPLLSPRRCRRGAALALLPAAGDGAELEEQVMDLLRLSSETGVFGRILLADCGLTAEGEKLCRLLARQYRQVIFCRREQLPDCLS